MPLLDILGSLASFAQGDIHGGISGLRQNAEHSKVEENNKRKKDMASQLMSDPTNQALFAKASPETQAYAKDALANGNFNEVQQIIGQEKKKGEVSTNRAAVASLLPQLATQAGATPEESQAALALHSSENPFSAVHFLQGIANRYTAADSRAKADLRQKNQNLLQLADQGIIAAKNDISNLKTQIDPNTQKIQDIQNNLRKNNFSESDLKEENLEDFKLKSGIKSAKEAKAFQQQIAAEQPNLIINTLKSVLSPISGGLIPPAEHPATSDLLDHYVSKNTNPDQIQQNLQAAQDIEQRKADIKANLTAKQAILTPKASATLQAAPPGAEEGAIVKQKSTGKTFKVTGGRLVPQR